MIIVGHPSSPTGTEEQKVAMSPDPTFAQPTFDEAWPQVRSRLRAALLARRVPADNVEDVVQETALRLYRSWSAVDPDRPLLPYAVTIAMNHWRDTLRRDPFREVPGDVPERADVDDVERTALARLEVSRVSRALRQLRPRDRDILLGADSPVDGPVPAARRMMLMRARRELMAILETASAWIAAGGLGLGALRSLAVGKGHPSSRTALATTGVLAAGLVSCVITTPYTTQVPLQAVPQTANLADPAPPHRFTYRRPSRSIGPVAVAPVPARASVAQRAPAACLPTDPNPGSQPQRNNGRGPVLSAGPLTVGLFHGASVATVTIAATGTHVESQNNGCAMVVPTSP